MRQRIDGQAADHGIGFDVPVRIEGGTGPQPSAAAKPAIMQCGIEFIFKFVNRVDPIIHRIDQSGRQDQGQIRQQFMLRHQHFGKIMIEAIESGREIVPPRRQPRHQIQLRAGQELASRAAAQKMLKHALVRRDVVGPRDTRPD